MTSTRAIPTNSPTAFKELQYAIALIGGYKGQKVQIINIEFGKGARNGWYTCIADDGAKLLYAGEELEILK